jgi:hypothetical protein
MRTLLACQGPHLKTEQSLLYVVEHHSIASTESSKLDSCSLHDFLNMQTWLISWLDPVFVLRFTVNPCFLFFSQRRRIFVRCSGNRLLSQSVDRKVYSLEEINLELIRNRNMLCLQHVRIPIFPPVQVV